MGKAGFALILFILLQHFVASTVIPDQRWQAWKKVYGKKYENFEEEHLRYVIWNENMKMIANHNAAGKHSYSLTMNHLGDFVSKKT